MVPVAVRPLCESTVSHFADRVVGIPVSDFASLFPFVFGVGEALKWLTVQFG